ncbi:MAG: phosphoribosyltransferase family protein [bacterium]
MLNFLLPARCPVCDCYVDAGGLCEPCREGLLECEPGCLTCGAHGWDGQKCPSCRVLLPHLDEVRVPWLFTGVLRDVIVDVKSKRDPRPLRPLCHEYDRWLCEAGIDATNWVSVPLHPIDLRQRGFSLPSLVCRFSGHPCQGVLTKTRTTEKQATLGRLARAHNVVGVFHAREISGAWVLVDDVVTTGATMNAAAGALRAAGAESVTAVALARTPET